MLLQTLELTGEMNTLPYPTLCHPTPLHLDITEVSFLPFSHSLRREYFMDAHAITVVKVKGGPGRVSLPCSVLGHPLLNSEPTLLNAAGAYRVLLNVG